MIGRVVEWAHVRDGEPTRDLSGVVVGCQLSGSKWLILVQGVDGSVQACEALDVRVVSVDLVDAPDSSAVELVDAPSPAAQLRKIVATIDDLGLPIGSGDPGDATCVLLRQLAGELRDLGAQREADEAKIATLIRERDEALARAREAERRPKKPKPEPAA